MVTVKPWLANKWFQLGSFWPFNLSTHYWLPYVRGATRQYNSSSSSPTSSFDSMDMSYVLMVRQLGSTSIADSVNEWPQRFPQQKRAPKKINDLLNQEYRNTSITGMNYQVSVVGLNMLFHRFAFVRSYLCSAYPICTYSWIPDYGVKQFLMANGHQDSSWKPHVRLAWPIEGGHCQAKQLAQLGLLTSQLVIGKKWEESWHVGQDANHQ